VLTSQRSLFESELALARTLQGQLVSVVQLYSALGGGWSVTDHPENNLPDPRIRAQPQSSTVLVDERQR
jgi:multidrug efflux system outer membrane protein